MFCTLHIANVTGILLFNLEYICFVRLMRIFSKKQTVLHQAYHISWSQNPLSLSQMLFSRTESDKMREMAVATESPPKGGFQFNDEQEYPPLNQKSDWEWATSLLSGAEPQLRYQLMFCTVLFIHLAVRVGEKIIFYLFDMEE